MKKHLFSSLVLGLLLLPQTVSANNLGVVISKVQTESLASASEEFITIANTTNTAIDVTGWHIQYFSAGTTSFSSPTRSIALASVIMAGGTLTVSSTGYNVGNSVAFFSAGLAATGGHVRIVSGAGATEQEHDRLGWGTATSPEATPATVVPKGAVYERQTLNGEVIDTNNNYNDFTPATAHVGALPVATEPSQSSNTYQDVAVSITELLPDPASPATDANDEFIELYNAQATPVALAGYKLQSGSSYSYTYTIKDEILAPYSYKAFYSSTTKLSLSNTKGAARLLGPNGNVIAEAPAYDKAPTGASWQAQGTTWAYSNQPSAGAQNVISATAQESAKVTATTKKAATKTTAKPKTSAVKAASTTAAKKAATTTDTKKPYQAPTGDKKSMPVNPLVLAGVGVVAVGYMIYEYRNDIANKLRQLKRNRAVS